MVDGPAGRAAWRILDAQYFGLAQRRKRVFVVFCAGNRADPAEVLFEREGVCRDHPPGRQARQDIAGTIGSRATGGGGLGTDFDLDGGLIARCLNAHPNRLDGESETFVCGALQGGGSPRGHGTAGINNQAVAAGHIVAYRTSGNCGAWDTGGRTDALTTGRDPNSHAVAFAQNQRDEVRAVDVAGALSSEPGMHQQTFVSAFQTSQSGTRQADTHATLDANNGSRRHNGAVVGSAVRRLTPRETCRLQGFPDDYLDITFRGRPAADGPKYRAVGNSFAVPVMAWIGRRIAAVDAGRA